MKIQIIQIQGTSYNTIPDAVDWVSAGPCVVPPED